MYSHIYIYIHRKSGEVPKGVLPNILINVC